MSNYDVRYCALVATFTANVLAAENAARKILTAQGRTLALSWYRIERANIESVAFDIRRERGAPMGDTSMLPAETAIAAAATLSPATSWGALLADLPSFLIAALDGDPCPAFATYGAQRVKAARIVRERRGIESVSGPKVTMFARALSGDASAVVVDRHAARIATGDDSITRVPLGTLRAIKGAYSAAASRLNLEPAGLQALVWVARVGFRGEYGGAS